MNAGHAEHCPGLALKPGETPKPLQDSRASAWRRRIAVRQTKDRTRTRHKHAEAMKERAVAARGRGRIFELAHIEILKEQKRGQLRHPQEGDVALRLDHMLDD